MRTRHLSSKEKSKLPLVAAGLLPEEEFRRLVTKGEVKLVEGASGEQFIILGNYVMLRRGDRILPVLLEQNNALLERLPSVKVDRGAIPNMVGGADVMRPGITVFDKTFKKGDLVVVRDEAYNKPLAIGVAVEDMEAAKSREKGKVVENIHHVEDKVWRQARQLIS